MKAVQPRSNRLIWLALGINLVSLMAVGCNRRDYRLRADNEVNYLINEKSNDPRWAVSDFTINIDPRSRYYDPYDPDAPPMPPDDPASHQFMHWVDGKKGYPLWHVDGDRDELENPAWRDLLPEYVEVNQQGEVVLTLDSALLLAQIHSPSYQNNLETLYLSALDVSTERFRLDTQFFGGNDTTYAHRGDLTSRIVGGRVVTTATGETNTLTNATDLQMRRRLATAGELLVGFANSFVWQFTGPDANAALSLVNFSIMQPLLRGAGRDVALEQLTIVERGLLANLRAFQRYREGFYTQVAIADLGVSGPQRRGGFFGGTGLTGFTGQGAGGLGGVGGATGFGRGGFGGGGGGGAGAGSGFAGGGAGNVGGFIGLLQTLQEIRNTEDSLELQLRTLELLEANLAAGIIDLVQVDQFRQNIETERANLLIARNGLQSGLDSYKSGILGLPPDLPIALDDEMIRQFQFVNRSLTVIQNELTDLQRELGDLPLDAPVDQLRGFLDRAAAFRTRMAGELDSLAGDLEHLENVSDQRQQRMTEAERQLYLRDKQQLNQDFAELQGLFQQYDQAFDQISNKLTEQTRAEVLRDTVRWMSDMLRLAQGLTLVQARTRLESVVLETIELSEQEAVTIAFNNRLDLLNNRAALVDSWRLITFNADALQSDLDVVFSGDMSTVGNNPLKFRAPTGRLTVGLQFDAPFTRLLERNNYRQSLIDYQRDRRSFIQFMDGIRQTMRQQLRDLEQLRVNLEIQRRAVAISIRRVDLTREELNRPVPPPLPGEPANTLGPTAALNLLTALSDLRNTQNNFMSVWLQYHATRMRLMRDMGVFELDEYGRWIDRPLDSMIVPGMEHIDLPPPVPFQMIQAASGSPLPADEQDLPPLEVARQPAARASSSKGSSRNAFR